MKGMFGLFEIFKGFFDVVMTADIKPFYYVTGPRKKNPVGQSGTDFPIGPVYEFQSHTGRRSLSLLQTFGKENNSVFNLLFSIVRQVFKKTRKYRFNIKSHCYRLFRCSRSFLAELNVLPLERRMVERSFNNFFGALKDVCASVFRLALFSNDAYSSNGRSTIGLFMCVNA